MLFRRPVYLFDRSVLYALPSLEAKTDGMRRNPVWRTKGKPQEVKRPSEKPFVQFQTASKQSRCLI
jgi:hypothetical protein